MSGSSPNYGNSWRAARNTAAILGMIFLIAPIIATIPLSFNDGIFMHYPLKGFSLRWYEEVISSSTWRDALVNSLIVGTATMALATVLGTLAALGVHRMPARWVVVLAGLLIAPMIVPHVISGLGLYLFLGSISLTSTFPGLILSHTLIATPLVFLTVSAALKNLDGTLLRAASTLGATPVYSFFTVTFPLTLPGVISGALLAFAASFDEVVLTIFVGGPAQRTIPKRMFEGIQESIDPSILAVSSLLIAFAVVLMVVREVIRLRSGNT